MNKLILKVIMLVSKQTNNTCSMGKLSSHVLMQLQCTSNNIIILNIYYLYYIIQGYWCYFHKFSEVDGK